MKECHKFPFQRYALLLARAKQKSFSNGTSSPKILFSKACPIFTHGKLSVKQKPLRAPDETMGEHQHKALLFKYLQLSVLGTVPTDEIFASDNIKFSPVSFRELHTAKTTEWKKPR